jgi:hypothetical protein
LKNLVDETIALNFDEIDNFDFPLNRLLLISVNYNDVQFDFIAYFRDNPNLLCFGSGAQNPYRKTKDGTTIKPPFFDRWSWYKYFDENYLVISDPTHYDDKNVQIGWYVGTNDTWYLEVISNIVRKIAVNRNVSNNNIMFYGTSGGGFASVGLSTLIRDSKVLVNNAQFFVMNYRSWAVNKLFSLLYQYYPSSNRDEIYKKIKHRLNHIELFKKMKYVPNIHYYVNANSEMDINNQCIPFLKEITNLDYFKGDYDIHLYHNNQGHLPLGKDESIELIRDFSKKHLYNPTKMKVGSFKVDIPTEFYAKSENKISDGNTTIILRDVEGDDIQNHIDEYVHTKRTKFGREVNVTCLNLLENIWKATLVDKAKYVHYWFEKDGQIFHFYTNSARGNIDDTIIKMIESISRT